MNRWIVNNRWAGQKLKNGWHTIMLMTSMLLLCIIIGWLFAGTTGMVGVWIATAASLLIAPGLSSRFMMRWFKAIPERSGRTGFSKKPDSNRAFGRLD